MEEKVTKVEFGPEEKTGYYTIAKQFEK